VPRARSRHGTLAFVAYDRSGYTVFSCEPYDFDGDGPAQDWAGAWGAVTLRTGDETAAAVELERLLGVAELRLAFPLRLAFVYAALPFVLGTVVRTFPCSTRGCETVQTRSGSWATPLTTSTTLRSLCS
jgi:hypothetical protein